MAVSSIMAVLSIAGTALGAYGSFQQAAQQQQSAATQEALARRNAQVADQNAQVAEEEGRAARREAHADAQRARLEAARMIGGERAMSGMSGAQVDIGSALDLNLDIAERGEVDALRRIEQGDEEDYKHRLKAGQYTVQAQNARVQADMYGNMAQSNIGTLKAGVSLLSSALSQGRGFQKYLNKNQAAL